VASLVDGKAGRWPSLAATLGSAKEISRLRACASSHVTFEIRRAFPYAPRRRSLGQIIAALGRDGRGPASRGRLKIGRPSPHALMGLMASYHPRARDRGFRLPVTLWPTARRSLEADHRALSRGPGTGTAVCPWPISTNHPKYGNWRPPSGAATAFARIRLAHV